MLPHLLCFEAAMNKHKAYATGLLAMAVVALSSWLLYQQPPSAPTTRPVSAESFELLKERPRLPNIPDLADPSKPARVGDLEVVLREVFRGRVATVGQE